MKMYADIMALFLAVWGRPTTLTPAEGVFRLDFLMLLYTRKTDTSVLKSKAGLTYHMLLFPKEWVMVPAPSESSESGCGVR